MRRDLRSWALWNTYAYNPRSEKVKTADGWFEACLVYIVSYKPVSE